MNQIGVRIMKSVDLPLLIASTLIFFGGCSRLLDPDRLIECRSDADCKAGERCEVSLGLCVPASEGKKCTSDDDCGSGLVCVDSRCVPSEAGGEKVSQDGGSPVPADSGKVQPDGGRDVGGIDATLDAGLVDGGKIQPDGGRDAGAGDAWFDAGLADGGDRCQCSEVGRCCDGCHYITGPCTPDDPHATAGSCHEGECLIDACAGGYEVSGDRRRCTPAGGIRPAEVSITPGVSGGGAGGAFQLFMDWNEGFLKYNGGER